MPGGQPLDLVLAVTSCEMCSGLLGSTSLTYQVVGCGQAVVQELAEHQPELGAMVGCRIAFSPPPLRVLVGMVWSGGAGCCGEGVV